MVTLGALWLPILLSAVFVFIASSVIHMVLPIHKGDWKALPDEEALMDAVRSQGIGQNMYMFPCPGSMSEMANPEVVAKYEKGPVGYLTVLPDGLPQIGKSLGQWFLFTLLVSVAIAYLATQALPTRLEFMRVLRFTGTAAFLAYAFSNVTDSIWKGIRWGVTWRFVLDGLVYALVTGMTCAWLWPE